MIQALLFLLGLGSVERLGSVGRVRNLGRLGRLGNLVIDANYSLITYSCAIRYRYTGGFCLYIGLRCRSYPDRKAM